jgi:hypothetical protein
MVCARCGLVRRPVRRACSELTLNATELEALGGLHFPSSEMVILLNGAFGIGKTTVARILLTRIPQSGIYDPEPLGVVLQRASYLAGRSVLDFQDLVLWRRLVVLGVLATSTIRSVMIVPMAFSNLSYLQEIRQGIGRYESSLLHFCLVARVEVVNDRLRRRHAGTVDQNTSWQYRRAAECCMAHPGPEFAEHIDTSDLDAGEVATEVLARVARIHRASPVQPGGWVTEQTGRMGNSSREWVSHGSASLAHRSGRGERC